MASKQETKTFTPASYDTSRYAYASVNSSYPLSTAVGKGSSNTTYAQWNLKTGSQAESYVFYKFDCSSIPADATINSVACSAKAYCSNTNTQRVATRTMQLFANTTAKGSAVTYSSASELNITCGTWSRTELNNCYIRIYAKRGTNNTTTTYYTRFYGATLTVTYTYNAVTYTITSSVSGEGTISPSGNTEVASGEEYSLVITPADSSAEISVKDNGVDVTSKLVDAPSGDQYSVTQKSGATYGFQQNYDSNCREGWWQSTNKAKASSASVATVSFNVAKTTAVTVRCICYAESTYDYFLVGPMDGSLNTNASADSNAVFTTKNNSSTNEQTYTFNNVAAGSHSFDVKYFKDSYTDSNWDSAQFIIEMSPSNGASGSKMYILTEVSGNHTIAVTIGGSGSEVLIKVDGVWKQAEAFKKVNGSWEPISASDINQDLNYLMHFT